MLFAFLDQPCQESNTLPNQPSHIAARGDDPVLQSLLALSLSEVMEHCAQLERSGQLREAINLYGLWLSKGEQKQRQIALFNLGVLLQAAGETAQAIEAYQSALADDEKLGPAYINLGLSLERLGKVEDALWTWGKLVARRYLKDRPEGGTLTTAFNHIGRLLENQRRFEAAQHALEQSLQIDPKQQGVLQHWFHNRQKSCLWPVDQPPPQIDANLLEASISPLAMLAQTDEPTRLRRNAGQFVERTYTFNNPPYKHDQANLRLQEDKRKLRVGYVSGDFKEHAVGFLLPVFFKEHDRQRLELFGYDFSGEDQSITRKSILSSFDQVRNISALSDGQAAQKIYDDAIDILIDLHGLSSGARPGIFSYRPGLLQGTYLGFIGTTAMPWIDFVLCDQVVVPPQARQDFTEVPVYMTGGFLPLPEKPAHAPRKSRSELRLPESAFVMCALGNTYKITPKMMKAWLELLEEIDGSVLWLIDDNPLATANLCAFATRQGIPAERLILSPRMPHLEFCQAMREANVFLDTFPYNCGSTSVDVINADLPLVTMYGHSMVSRMGLSLLSALGKAEWATDRLDVYKRIVHQIHAAWQEGQSFRYNTTGYRLGITEALLSLKEHQWYLS